MNNFEIKGIVNTAICYAKVYEHSAVEQIRRMCDYDLTKGSQIRIMPDVHAGAGCTIGTTMTITDRICPNVVGVDIGCGMFTARLEETAADFKKVDAAAHNIPSGKNAWDKPFEEFDLSGLRCLSKLHDIGWIRNSLGTLGGGNHFIEIDRASDKTLYLVIHSGSRNLGKQVAEYYQQLAIDLQHGVLDYPKKSRELIAVLKAEGRSSEIQSELKRLRAEMAECEIPDDLCYLTGQYLDDYLHDVEICQAFARRSREIMADIIVNTAGLAIAESFHTIHNYIDTDEMILRKGAIAAHDGEKVLIPVNMRDGSIIAIGKGNPEWNYSAPHGAGRIMSRSGARQTLSLEEYQKEMAGIYTTSVNENALDEAPMAYKRLEDIIDVVRETVDIIDVMKPVYNFKASE